MWRVFIIHMLNLQSLRIVLTPMNKAPLLTIYATLISSGIESGMITRFVSSTSSIAPLVKIKSSALRLCARAMPSTPIVCLQHGCDEMPPDIKQICSVFNIKYRPWSPWFNFSHSHCSVSVKMRRSCYLMSLYLALGAIWVWELCNGTYRTIRWNVYTKYRKNQKTERKIVSTVTSTCTANIALPTNVPRGNKFYIYFSINSHKMLFSVSGFSIFSLFCTVFRLFMHIFQHHVMTQQLDLIALNVRENGLLWRHHKQTSCFFHFCCRIYTTTNTLSSYLSLHILETFFSVVELMINFNVPTWERWEDCVVNFHTFQYEMYC